MFQVSPDLLDQRRSKGPDLEFDPHSPHHQVDAVLGIQTHFRLELDLVLGQYLAHGLLEVSLMCYREPIGFEERLECFGCHGGVVPPMSQDPKTTILEFLDAAEVQREGRTIRTGEPNTDMEFEDVVVHSIPVTTKPGQTLGSALLDKIFNVDTAASQIQKVCGWCKKPVGEFKDEVSAREYKISAMCQPCQDLAFVEPEELEEPEEG